LIKKNAKTLGAALRRSGRDLTDKGELITLWPINLTTGGRPALEEQIAWIRHNAETRAR